MTTNLRIEDALNKYSSPEHPQSYGKYDADELAELAGRIYGVLIYCAKYKHFITYLGLMKYCDTGYLKGNCVGQCSGAALYKIADYCRAQNLPDITFLCVNSAGSKKTKGQPSSKGVEDQIREYRCKNADGKTTGEITELKIKQVQDFDWSSEVEKYGLKVPKPLEIGRFLF